MKIKPVITYLRYSSKSRTNHTTMVSTDCFSKESWLTAAALSLLGQRERVKSLECGLRSLNAFISHPRVHDNFAQSTQARDAAPRTVRDDHSFFSPLFSPDGIPPFIGFVPFCSTFRGQYKDHISKVPVPRGEDVNSSFIFWAGIQSTA